MAIAAFAVLTAASASAATVYKKTGEISGPEAGVSFLSLKSESVAINNKNGHIYVADSGDGLIYDFESSADTTPEIWDGTNTPALSFGGEKVAVAVDNTSGDVYVSDSAHKVIDKFDEDGNLITSFGDTAGTHDGQLAGLATPAGSFSPPTSELAVFGIAVDQSNRDLYAIDAGHEVIDVFDSSGGYLEQFTEKPGGLYRSEGRFTDGIAVKAGTGEVIASDSSDLKAYRFEAAGVVVEPPIDGSTTPAGSFGTSSISIAAANGSGTTYVADAEHSVIDAFATDGAYLSQITGLATPRGLAVDQATGDVYSSEAAGTVQIFSLLPAPEVITRQPSALTQDSATLNGEVDPAGAGPIVDCHFLVSGGIGEVPCAQATPITAPTAVSAAVILAPNTSYTYRLVASNAAATNEGATVALRSPGPPIVESESATTVSSSSATLTAEINPESFPTTYHFEYDTRPYAEGEASHGTVLPIPDAAAGSGVLGVVRSVAMQGLLSGTTYHYRVVATNGCEPGARCATQGGDRTFTTQGIFAALLPDDRGWELVSPANKHGSPLEPRNNEGGVIQAAANGDAITYVALGPVTVEPAGTRSPEMSQLFSRRGTDGWTTQEISTPHEEIEPVKVGHVAEYQAFSEDLSAGLVEPAGATPLSSATSERTPYLWLSTGSFSPLVTGCPAAGQCPAAVAEHANVPRGSKFGGEKIEGKFSGGVELTGGASLDQGHIVVTSESLLTNDFAAGFEANGDPNLYEYSDGTLTLVSILPDGRPTSEDGVAAGLGNFTEHDVRGALSTNGDRVVFQGGSSLEEHLYLRDVALQKTIQLDEPRSGIPGGRGAPVFQGASPDGTRVFFTDPERLTPDSTSTPGKPDLYMCEVQVTGTLHCNLNDLTVDPNLGEAANVRNYISFNTAADRIYFTADGMLTTALNNAGERPVHGNCGATSEASVCNLYSYDVATRELTFVAVLSGADYPDWGREDALPGLTTRVSPNGRYFAFMSERSLTGYDNRDDRTGARAEEVFLYDGVTGQLHCVSCNPTGALPLGIFEGGAYHERVVDYSRAWTEHTLAALIPGWTPDALSTSSYQSRYLSNSGRLFFDSSDALVPQDSNGVMDVYEYEPPAGEGQPVSNDCTTASPTYGPKSAGCVNLISSGTSPEESAFLDADEEGENVFFLTASRLVAQDTDSAYDVYDARVGGSSTPPAKPVECQGDACQQPASPPVHSTPGTALLNGPGNLLQCPKGKVVKKGKCIKKHQKKKGKKHKKKSQKKSSKPKAKKQKDKRAADSKHGGQK